MLTNFGESRFTYAISTMGCKANLTDSQALEEKLQSLGGVAAPEEEAQFFLLNTCTVTDEADKEARKILRKSKAAFTVATGCLAQVDPEQLEKAAPQNAKLKVLRNSAKESVETLVQEWLQGEFKNQERVLHGDRVGWHSRIMSNRSALSAPQAAHRTRAFYKVQDGCNAFCSYCVIPLARGRSRSLNPAQIVSEVEGFAQSGVQELALTAIHAADYEAEGLDFTGLVAKILRETSIKRLRLTSLDPAEISDELISLMAQEPRLCPHFHVSLQAANTRVLQGMKRGYDADRIEDRLSAIAHRLPHAYVGMDIIAGFPGETDAEFEDTYERLARLPWTKAHVFPFSVRRNTAAARLVETGLAVPAHKIHERAKRLRALSGEKMQAALAQKIGTVMEVLVEEKKVLVNGRVCSQGHARNFHKVLIPGSHPANQLRRVRILGSAEKDFLKGELL